jgi:hypothetical protein
MILSSEIANLLQLRNFGIIFLAIRNASQGHAYSIRLCG